MPIRARRDARTRAGRRESPVGVKKKLPKSGSSAALPRATGGARAATKLGVRAGLEVGGTGRGARVGGGAPAGRAGGGEGRNLIGMAVLVRADWVKTMLNNPGWFYTAVSRTKTRDGLVLNSDELPMEHIQGRRHAVLAELARLGVLHEQTRIRVHGTAATTAADKKRLDEAQANLATARQKFRAAR